jgi:uncharacterized protein YciI
MADKHWLMLYDLSPDYLEKRGPLRAGHLALARAAAERGELVLAGAFADPPDGAAYIFKGPDGSAASAFAHADPYVQNGLVSAWRVREWTTVAGKDALTIVT